MWSAISPEEWQAKRRYYAHVVDGGHYLGSFFAVSNENGLFLKYIACIK